MEKHSSEKEYKAVIKRINDLIDAERTEAVHNELTLLSFQVED